MGETCGDMLEAMARITPSQPNDAMARIASHRNTNPAQKKRMEPLSKIHKREVE